jgi:hypothetical protein
MADLKGKKVAILTENGFEEIELTSPQKALKEAGAEVHIVSPQKDKVKGWDHDHWSIDVKVDVPLDKANPEDAGGSHLSRSAIAYRDGAYRGKKHDIVSFHQDRPPECRGYVG